MIKGNNNSITITNNKYDSKFQEERVKLMSSFNATDLPCTSTESLDHISNETRQLRINYLVAVEQILVQVLDMEQINQELYESKLKEMEDKLGISNPQTKGGVLVELLDQSYKELTGALGISLALSLKKVCNQLLLSNYLICVLLTC
jgi:hypothetical protein